MKFGDGVGGCLLGLNRVRHLGCTCVNENINVIVLGGLVSKRMKPKADVTQAPSHPPLFR